MKNKGKLINIKNIMVAAVVITIVGASSVFFADGSSSVTMNGVTSNVNKMEINSRKSQLYIDVRKNNYVLWENQGPAELLLFAHDYGAGKHAIALEVGDTITLTRNGVDKEYKVEIKQIDGWDYRQPDNIFYKEAEMHDLTIHSCAETEGFNYYLFLNEI